VRVSDAEMLELVVDVAVTDEQSSVPHENVPSRHKTKTV
jgi:hypothetical protein